VAEHGRAVAIAGASGSGKSTTALACLAAGMSILGDDACIAELGSSPNLFSVYGLAKLEPDALARLPGLADLALGTDDRTGQILLDPGARHVEQASLAAVVLPHIVDDRRTRIRAISPRDALRVLVPGSLLEGAGAGGSALRSLAALVQCVPCLRIELGTELDGVVTGVRQAIEAG
jgi:hypothetical protein